MVIVVQTSLRSLRDADKDFNYFSDATWILNQQLHLISDSVLTDTRKPAIAFMNKKGVEEFCAKGKMGLDNLVADSRRDHMQQLINARLAWGKK